MWWLRTSESSILRWQKAQDLSVARPELGSVSFCQVPLVPRTHGSSPDSMWEGSQQKAPWGPLWKQAAAQCDEQNLWRAHRLCWENREAQAWDREGFWKILKLEQIF